MNTPQISERDARDLFETAVALSAVKARKALPESGTRVDKAMQLVLDGSVELQGDHSARVTSQRDGETVYFVVNGSCQCRDFPNAPSGWCKHRLARALTVKALQIAKELGPVATAAPPDRSPGQAAESPQHAIPQEFIVTIQGKPFITFQGLLHLAHQQGLLSLKAEFISVTADLALAKARAEFHDGRLFEECGDATPQNVNSRIAPHFARMALTRAKARCLRDALNVHLVAVEELD